MRARNAFVVSHWKAGTNLMVRLMQGAGYECKGAGTGLEPGAGGRPDVVKIADELREGRLPPADVAMFVHSAPLAEMPMPLARALSAHHELLPAIFNYRDPRAVLVSAVNYLRRTPPPDHHASYLFLAPILARFPTAREALPVAMDLLGEVIKNRYVQCVWLLHHPHVCKVRYEDLVGSRGGGTDEAQLDAVTRVLSRLGAVDREPRQVAGELFDPSSRTFFRSRVDGWRDDFDPACEQRFLAQFGDVMRMYGYPLF